MQVNVAEMDMPAPKEGFVVTHFLTVKDPRRSARFYADVLGGTIVMEGEPSIVKVANTWIIVNVGGGPTDDKPDVVLEAPTDTKRVNAFLNIRVADIRKSVREWTARGATFLTDVKDHERELRCYMKDPDGYLIEVGQMKA